MRNPRRLYTGVTVLTLCVLGGNARANTVTFTGSTLDGGTGFGNVANVLGLQVNGSEAGSVTTSWNGSAFTTDAENGDAKPNSRTWSLGELLADKGINLNANNFGVIFNINETGTDIDEEVDLYSFTVDFYLTNGSTFSALYTPPAVPGYQTLDIGGQGTGNSGYLFRVNFTPANAAAFFADQNNRIGMTVSNIDRTNDGIDNFYIAEAPPVPLPPAVLAGVTLIGGLGLGRLVRRGRTEG